MENKSEQYAICAKCAYGYQPVNETVRVFCTHPNPIDIIKRSFISNVCCITFVNKENKNV